MTDSSANRSPKKTALIITQPDKKKARTESSESDSAFRKMAAASRKQFYDLANPGKQLLKQLSTADMEKAARASLMTYESVNQSVLDACGFSAALSFADSERKRMMKQVELVNDSCFGYREAMAREIGAIQNFKGLSATVGFDSAEALAEKINPKAFDVAALGMATLPQPDFFASEAMKLQESSVAGWMERLFLNPIEDYLGISSSLYLPSDSILIRSTPKTKRQKERLTEFKKRDEAENTSIITPDQSDFRLALLEVAADTAKKSGLPPPKSLNELVSFLASINQILEAQKPKIVESERPTNVRKNDGNLVNQEKRLVPIERGTTELLVLIYEVLGAFGVEIGDSLSKLGAKAAWGMIIARKFNSDLINDIKGERRAAVLILNGGDEIDFPTFARTYNRRFR